MAQFRTAVIALLISTWAICVAFHGYPDVVGDASGLLPLLFVLLAVIGLLLRPLFRGVDGSQDERLALIATGFAFLTVVLTLLITPRGDVDGLPGVSFLFVFAAIGLGVEAGAALKRLTTWGRQFIRQLGLIAITILTLYPVLWVVKIAFEPGAGLGVGLSPIPTEFTLDHFRTVVSTTDSFGQALFPFQLANSLIISVSTAIIGVILSVTAGYAFSRFKFPGKELGMKAFLTTQMFPGVVMAIPLYILLDEAGMLNSLLGLTLVYSTTSVPFSVWMLKGYFDTISTDLEEAAFVDGASRLRTLVTIIMPLAMPAIVVTALFSFMTAWNEFILAATFLSGERNITLPVVLHSFVDENSTDWGPFAAGAVIVSLPVMALFFLLQKHLVGGLTAGGVKG